MLGSLLSVFLSTFACHRLEKKHRLNAAVHRIKQIKKYFGLVDEIFTILLNSLHQLSKIMWLYQGHKIMCFCHFYYKKRHKSVILTRPHVVLVF